MEWSYSASKLFHQCQRRWYFKQIVANSHPNAKDPVRREIHLLSQLQSIEAWRGSVVDTAIEKEIILPLNAVGRFSERRVMKYAHEIFHKQLKFASKLRSREPGMTQKKGGREYAALFNLEYGLPLQDDVLEQAWTDVELALFNLMDNDEIITALVEAKYRVAQRTLYIQHDDFTLTAKPDVIAFYANKPALIIDWKVQTTGRREYWLQLACYALALTQSKAHTDFSRFTPVQYSPTEIRLAEFQLLLPQVRWYSLTDDDADAVEEYIESSVTDMLLSLGKDGAKVMQPLAFDITQYPENCETCPFQKACGVKRLWAS